MAWFMRPKCLTMPWRNRTRSDKPRRVRIERPMLILQRSPAVEPHHAALSEGLAKTVDHAGLDVDGDHLVRTGDPGSLDG